MGNKLLMSKEEIEDSISNLKFNRASIERNQGLRGVIFREVRVLCNQIDNSLRIPQWQQLLNLIDEQIIKLKIKLEEYEKRDARGLEKNTRI